MLLVPFWEYRKLIDGHISILHDILLNMVMFMPIGFLIPVVTGKNLKFVFLISIIFSAMIESGQLAFQRGWCEIDDILNNTVGACIGFLMYSSIKKLYERIGKK